MKDNKEEIIDNLEKMIDNLEKIINQEEEMEEHLMKIEKLVTSQDIIMMQAFMWEISLLELMK